jgi:menaquinone-dependent protoporphyrinogen oxidase
MDSRRILIVYDTREGQSEEVAQRIGTRARNSGVLADLVPCTVPAPSLDQFDGVVVGGSVHAGHHGKDLVRFVREQRGALEAKHSAFFSVSLSAAGQTERNRADAARLIEQFVNETGWTPVQQMAVAGALKYREYNFLMRWIMRRIAKAQGGDTDTSRDYEYTDWDAVDAFTEAFLARVGSRQPERGDAGESPVAARA